MDNLFFSKNNFVNNQPARLAKPINNDPTKLGRKTVEEIKHEMHPQPNVNKDEKEQKTFDIQSNNYSKLNDMKAFKNWHSN